MPGISFISDFSHDLTEKEAMFHHALHSTLHFPHYRSEVHISERDVFLGCTSYEGYPFRSVETEDCIFYIEGMIYDYQGLEKSLKQLSKILSAHMTDRTDLLKGWLIESEGDYVITALIKRTGDIVIMNDLLGRLPLYYHRKATGISVSREISFMTCLLGNKSLDRMAIAQTLLVGFAWGGRTLLEGVKRLEPASAIHIHRRESCVSIRNIYLFNFDDKKNYRVTASNIAKTLVELFVDACSRRSRAFQENSNILGLSGGLDSRAVGAGLLKSGAPVEAVSYLDHAGNAAGDVVIARQLADVMNIKWRLISLSPPKGRDFLMLLRIKSGLNYLGMSYILPFFDEIRQMFSPGISYFTGDGGQILKPEFRVYVKLLSIHNLIKHILSQNGVFSLSDVAFLTGISEHEIIEDLRGLIGSYPEQSLQGKYSHFLMYEENVNKCFEGEDRNRFFFWSMTPFYSMPFFEYTMSTPDRIVNRFTLCREFLKFLEPNVAVLDNAQWFIPVTSWRIHFVFLYHMMPSRLKMLLRRAFKKPPSSYAHDSVVVNCLHKQIQSCEDVGRQLSGLAVKKTMSGWHKQQFESILTVSSVIEALTCGRSIFEQYTDVYFS